MREYRMNNRHEIPCRNGLECSYAKRGNCWFYHKEGQAEKRVWVPPPEPVTVVKLEKFEDWSKAPDVKKREFEFGEDYDEEEESDKESEDDDEIEDEEELLKKMFEKESESEFDNDDEECTEEEEEELFFTFVKELQTPTLCKKVLARGWKCNKKLPNCPCVNLSEEYYNRTEFIQARHDVEEHDDIDCIEVGSCAYVEDETTEEEETDNEEESDEFYESFESFGESKDGWFSSNWDFYPHDEEHSGLVKAARNGNLDMVIQILRNCPEDKKSETLNKARRWTEVVEKMGYDKSWEWFDDTPLIAAARAGHFDIVKLLLMEGADPTLKSCHTDDVYETAEQAARSGNIINLLREAVKYWNVATYSSAHASERYFKERRDAFATNPNRPIDGESLINALSTIEINTRF